MVKHHIGIGQLADFCGNRRIFPVLNRSTFLITWTIFTDATVGTHLPSQLVSHENRSATLFSNPILLVSVPWSRYLPKDSDNPYRRSHVPMLPFLPYENSKRVNNSFPSLPRIFRQNEFELYTLDPLIWIRIFSGKFSLSIVKFYFYHIRLLNRERIYETSYKRFYSSR